MRIKRYNMVIPTGNVKEVEKCLQLVCGAYDAYPYRITRANDIIIASFAKDNVPEYIYSGNMFAMVDLLKSMLELKTIILKQAFVEKECFPASIKNICGSAKTKEVNDDISKKYQEDAHLLNGYTNIKESQNNKKDIKEYHLLLDLDCIHVVLI